MNGFGIAKTFGSISFRLDCLVFKCNNNTKKSAEITTNLCTTLSY